MARRIKGAWDEGIILDECISKKSESRSFSMKPKIPKRIIDEKDILKANTIPSLEN